MDSNNYLLQISRHLLMSYLTIIGTDPEFPNNLLSEIQMEKLIRQYKYALEMRRQKDYYMYIKVIRQMIERISITIKQGVVTEWIEYYNGYLYGFYDFGSGYIYRMELDIEMPEMYIF